MKLEEGKSSGRVQKGFRISPEAIKIIEQLAFDCAISESDLLDKFILSAEEDLYVLNFKTRYLKEHPVTEEQKQKSYKNRSGSSQRLNQARNNKYIKRNLRNMKLELSSLFQESEDAVFNLSNNLKKEILHTLLNHSKEHDQDLNDLKLMRYYLDDALISDEVISEFVVGAVKLYQNDLKSESFFESYLWFSSIAPSEQGYKVVLKDNTLKDHIDPSAFVKTVEGLLNKGSQVHAKDKPYLAFLTALDN